jgi:hypothetical protein
MPRMQVVSLGDVKTTAFQEVNGREYCVHAVNILEVLMEITFSTHIVFSTGAEGDLSPHGMDTRPLKDRSLPELVLPGFDSVFEPGGPMYLAVGVQGRLLA